MPSEEDYLSTPSGYATPEQLSSVRDYAKALLYGSGQQPVQHWTQGLSNMVSALVGGYTLHRAGERDAGSRLYENSTARAPGDKSPDVGYMPGTPEMRGIGTEGVLAPPAPSASGKSASVRNNNPGAQWPGPVAASFGSTGSQNVSGNNKIATFDDPIKGAAAQFGLLAKNYAGMPLASAIAKWSGGNSAPAYAAAVSRAAGIPQDTPITPQLLASPKGVALVKAMANWEAGGQFPMTDQQWVRAQKLALGGAGGAQPMAFSGEPVPNAPAAPDAPSALATALARVPAGQPGAPASPGVPGGHVGVDPDTGQALIPPGLVPQRTPVTYGQFVRAMASPRMDPALKQFIMQSYYGQGQPLEMPTTGGRVVINPQNPKQQMYIPDLQKGNIKGPGGSEIPVYQTIGPKGDIKTLDEAGGATPRAPVGGAGTPSPVNVPDLKFAPDDGTTGRMPPGMLGALPPEITGGASAPAPKGDRVAQLPGYANRMIDSLNQKGIEYEGGKKAVDKDVESYQKKYDTTVDMGLRAKETMPTLKMARELIEDPKFKQGIFADPMVDIARLKAVTGIDPKAAAANEAFDKIISGNIIKDLRVELQGTGQVRVAELDLLSKAAANRYNSLGANRAVLELMMRSHNLASGMGSVAQAYSQGIRWDENGKVIRDANGNAVVHNDRPTSSGLSKALQTYAGSHPIASDEEIKKYESMFDKDAKYGRPPPAKGKKAAPKAAPVWQPGSPNLPPGVE